MTVEKEKKKPGTRINSKHKGSEYERKVAKKLGSWWGEEFHRTPMSGGLHWANDNRVAGDIVTPPTSIYPWVTELKKREEWEFDHLLKGTGEMEKYWKQVQADAQRTGMRELLIFSKNFAPDYLMLGLDDFLSILKASEERSGKSAQFNYFIVHKIGHDNRAICILDDFITYITKGDVIRALQLQVSVKHP